MMLGLSILLGGDFMLSHEQREARNRARRARIEERLATVAPWSPDIKWERELNLSAESYQSQLRHLFEVEPANLRSNTNPLTIPEKCRVVSGCKSWIYCENIVPRGFDLQTLSGRRQGTVMWDGDVVIPSLYEARRLAWDGNPWMSLTPMEFITLRAGTRLAKGHVVIAGLGLGHQLHEVSHRKQVKRITLVERSASLVEFILPRVQPYLGCPVDIVIDNAFKALPKMEADVALIDVFPKYGGNSFEPCPKIKRVWCWGSA